MTKVERLAVFVYFGFGFRMLLSSLVVTVFVERGTELGLDEGEAELVEGGRSELSEGTVVVVSAVLVAGEITVLSTSTSTEYEGTRRE